MCNVVYKLCHLRSSLLELELNFQLQLASVRALEHAMVKCPANAQRVTELGGIVRLVELVLWCSE